MAVIEVENLRYRYPRQERLALDGITFTVEPGEFIGVIGPNLAGKSTLCQALVGLVPHFYKGAIGGQVRVAGLDVHRSTVAEVSRRAGLVFQNPFTQISGAKLTVYEEVAFGLEHAGVPREEMRRRIDEALRLLGLEAVKDSEPLRPLGRPDAAPGHRLGAGHGAGGAHLGRAHLPAGPAGTEEVFEAVTALCRRGMAVVMAEHKVDRLAEHADRILVLHQGRQIAYGPPRQVFARENVAALGVAVPAVTQAAKALGWVLEDGTYPVTLAEAVAVGQARRGGR